MSDSKFGDDRDPKVMALLQEIAAVCKKHGMSLGHEDRHGGFKVMPSWDQWHEDWLLGAGQEVPDEPDPISSEAMTLLRMLNGTISRFPVPEDRTQPEHVAELRTRGFIQYIFGLDPAGESSVTRWICISDKGREYLSEHDA